MLSTIVTWLLDYYPQIAGYAIVISFTAFVVWKSAVFYTKTNAAVKEMDDIHPLLQKISAGLSTLNNILLEKDVISRSYYSEENSPRVLNEAGKNLLKTSGAATLLDSIKEEMLQELEKQNIDSFLEAERASLNILLEKMNDTRFKEIQNFAYQHPTFNEKALTYTDILFVMSLVLRDEYIARHPEKLKTT